MSLIPVTVDEAVAAIEAQARVDKKIGSRTVHWISVGGSGGMIPDDDWDVATVVRVIRAAVRLAWYDRAPLGHDLAAQTPEGHIYLFNVKRPEAATS